LKKLRQLTERIVSGSRCGVEAVAAVSSYR
jgi:hypothetical protein